MLLFNSIEDKASYNKSDCLNLPRFYRAFSFLRAFFIEQIIAIIKTQTKIPPKIIKFLAVSLNPEFSGLSSQFQTLSEPSLIGVLH